MKHKQSFYFSVILLIVTLCGVGKNSFGQYIQLNDPRYVFPNYSRTNGIRVNYFGCEYSAIGNYPTSPNICIQTFGVNTEHIHFRLLLCFVLFIFY